MYNRNYRRPRGPRYNIRKIIFWPLTVILFFVLIAEMIMISRAKEFGAMGPIFMLTIIGIIGSAAIAAYN